MTKYPINATISPMPGKFLNDGGDGGDGFQHDIALKSQNQSIMQGLIVFKLPN